MNLVELLKRPAGKTLEFKRDLSTAEGALKTIVAFTNTAGGTLLLGVEDGSRHVRRVRSRLLEVASPGQARAQRHVLRSDYGHGRSRVIPRRSPAAGRTLRAIAAR